MNNWFKPSQEKANVNNKVLYSAILLNDESSKALWNHIKDRVPKEWKKYCHHMTINLGQLKNREDIGREVTLTAYEYGIDDRAAAVKVNGFSRDGGGIPHITVAVNWDNGGRPKHSNDIKNWVSISQIDINGIIEEVKG